MDRESYPVSQLSSHIQGLNIESGIQNRNKKIQWIPQVLVSVDAVLIVYIICLGLMVFSFDWSVNRPLIFEVYFLVFYTWSQSTWQTVGKNDGNGKFMHCSVPAFYSGGGAKKSLFSKIRKVTGFILKVVRVSISVQVRGTDPQPAAEPSRSTSSPYLHSQIYVSQRDALID